MGPIRIKLWIILYSYVLVLSFATEETALQTSNFKVCFGRRDDVIVIGGSATSSFIFGLASCGLVERGEGGINQSYKTGIGVNESSSVNYGFEKNHVPIVLTTGYWYISFIKCQNIINISQPHSHSK